MDIIRSWIWLAQFGNSNIEQEYNLKYFGMDSIFNIQEVANCVLEYTLVDSRC
jgi:hypothetical protein